MNSERRKMLEQFAQEDPNDPFNIYALALDYATDNRTQAEQLFTQLLEKHPDYLPVYYAAADFFTAGNETERATKILENGITIATQQNNQKTLRELKAALLNLDF